LEIPIQILSAFPTPVGMVSVGRALTEPEQALLLNLPMGPDPGGGGNRSSVNTRVLDEPAVAGLKAFIATALNYYFDETYKPAAKVSLKITQSWVNYTLPRHYHGKHTHPNSLVSGVFYINAQREHDKIAFVRDAYERIVIPVRELNMFSSNVWMMNVGTGDLLFFPSDLPHMVEPTTSPQTRISLSFNTFPEGFIGDERRLAGLTLGNVR
jgi:uncharacterized protein (TIGR02466 family)